MFRIVCINENETVGAGAADEYAGILAGTMDRAGMRVEDFEGLDGVASFKVHGRDAKIETIIAENARDDIIVKIQD